MTSEAPNKPSRSEIENALSGRTQKATAKQRKRRADAEFNFEASPRRQQVIGGDLTGVAKRNNAGLFSRYGKISIANWVAGMLVMLILAAFFWPKGAEPIREIGDRSESTETASIYTEARLDDEAEPADQVQSFGRETDLDRAGKFRETDALEIQIRKLIAVADGFIAKGAYTQPHNSNATHAYQNILKLDPRNVAAKQGLDYINSRFLAAGIAALDDENLTLAEASLSRLASVDSESEEYTELSAVLENWKIQRKIDELLANAEEAKVENNFILPARENALYFFQEVQVLEEENAAALKGINDIANIYVERANEAILQGRYEAGTGYLATVSVIDPKHPSIPLLEALITTAEPIAQKSRRAASLGSTAAAKPPSTISPAPTVANSAPNTTANNQPNNRVNTSDVDTAGMQNIEPAQTSGNRTPQKEANEQAAFDKQYLNRGLAAYYRGDYDAAAALLQPLADKGVSRAQFRIGYMYYLGRGFKRDRTEADRVIRAALPAIKKFAEEGRTWAQSDLGSLYEDGLVLPRDYGEAVYWYRSSAEKGYPGAQTNLGIMYARGRGVTTSRRTAIEWFQRAAKQGDIAAQKNLEAMGVK